MGRKENRCFWNITIVFYRIDWSNRLKIWRNWKIWKCYFILTKGTAALTWWIVFFLQSLHFSFSFLRNFTRFLGNNRSSNDKCWGSCWLRKNSFLERNAYCIWILNSLPLLSLFLFFLFMASRIPSFSEKNFLNTKCLKSVVAL